MPWQDLHLPPPQLLTCSSSTPDWSILQFQAGKKRENTLLKGEC